MTTITPMDELLSVDTLTGMIRHYADQAEERACTQVFQGNAKRLTPAGTTASWDEVEFNRHFAPVTGPDSPHTQVRRLGQKKRASSMAMIKVYKDLPAGHLFLERAPGKETADAEAILSAELEDMANLIANTREFLACGALLGKIEVNEQTVPGSELNFEIKFPIQEMDALDDWANPDTLIRSREFMRIKREYRETAGMRAQQVITEPNLETYFVENKQIQTFAKEALGVQILTTVNDMGQNAQWNLLGGLSWRFTDGIYQPENGPVQRYFPQDTALILPQSARLRSVLGWAEGKVHVPAGPIYGNVENAAGLIREMRGFYAYAKIRDDPVGVRVYAGWHGLPVVLNPRAILRFKVRPGATPTP